MLFITSQSLSAKGTDTTNLSLSYAVQRFLNLARKSGIDAHELLLPEIYRTEKAKEYMPGSIHPEKKELVNLFVGAWDKARMLLGVKNILHLSWEQPYISNPPYRSGFKLNMIDTLKKYDQIWACAEFVNKALRENGINAITMPTPVCEPDFTEEDLSVLENLVITIKSGIFSPTFNTLSPEELCKGWHNNDWKKLLAMIQDGKKRGPLKIFLTQGNMGDMRKNILGVMSGFSLFSGDNPDAILLIKTHRTIREIYAELGPHIRDYFGWGPWYNNHVFILSANLSSDQQKLLYRASDYYLCCPLAEGQNVPLQEAIQHNCYPVTPVHTAMSEYLDAELITEIPSYAKELTPNDYCNAPLNNYTGYITDTMDIADACQIAFDMPKSERTAKNQELSRKNIAKYTYESLSIKFCEAISSC